MIWYLFCTNILNCTYFHHSTTLIHSFSHIIPFTYNISNISSHFTYISTVSANSHFHHRLSMSPRNHLRYQLLTPSQYPIPPIGYKRHNDIMILWYCLSSYHYLLRMSFFCFGIEIIHDLLMSVATKTHSLPFGWGLSYKLC